MSNTLEKSIENSNIITIDRFKVPEFTFFGIEFNSLDRLTKTEYNFLKSINYQLINKINSKDLIQIIFAIISNNLRALSSKMKAEDIVLLTNDFTNEISSYFSMFSIKEIENIIHSGIRGKFDTEKHQTIGLSVVNFNIWAKIYSEKRLKYTLEINKKIGVKKTNDPKTKITKESLLKIINSDYIYYKKIYLSSSKTNRIGHNLESFFIKNAIQVSANFIFKHLIKLKLLTLSNFQEQKDLLISSKYAPNNKDIFKLGMSNSKKIDEEAKRICCCLYFLNENK